MLDFGQKRRLVNYHIESRRSRLTTEEGYDFAFIPKGMEPDSAAWRYDERRHRHNLMVNLALDEIANRPSLGYSAKTAFIYKVYDHEGAHSLYTDRDNKKLGELQKKAKIPFGLWNLFEDARIEAAWRKDFRRRSNWLRYMLLVDEEPPDPLAMPGEPKNAIRLFLDCIRMENSFKQLKAWVAADKDPKIQFRGKGKAKYGRRHLVRWFWRQAIRKSNTVDLLPLIRWWIETFPETAPPSCGGTGAEPILVGIHGGDMPKEAGGEMPAYAVDADGSEHEEIKETIQPMSGSGGGSIDREVGTKAVEEKKEDYHYKGESKTFKVPRNRYFSTAKTQELDRKRADNLIRLFAKFLEGGEGVITSRNPSSRIDMRKFLRGAEDIYLRKGDDPYGVKRISFIMDCSGSMSRASGEGVYLAYVLNELVRQRKIECKQMVLTGGDNAVIPMPFDSRILEHLQTPGAHEGFVRAMEENEKDLLESDLTIFFTDGNITDEHIVKSDWHRKGVYTIGLFTGDPSRSASLHRWFDSVLVRNDIESVADSLIQLIKRQ